LETENDILFKTFFWAKITFILKRRKYYFEDKLKITSTPPLLDISSWPERGGDGDSKDDASPIRKSIFPVSLRVLAHSN